MTDTKNIKYLAMRLVSVILTTCTDTKVLEGVKQLIDEQVGQLDSEAASILNYANRSITLKILELKGHTQVIELVNTDPGEFEKALLMLTKATEQLVFAEEYIPEIIEKYLEHIMIQEKQLRKLQDEIDSKLYKECITKIHLMRDSCQCAKLRYKEKHNK